MPTPSPSKPSPSPKVSPLQTIKTFRRDYENSAAKLSKSNATGQGYLRISAPSANLVKLVGSGSLEKIVGLDKLLNFQR